jgi:diguanylate cyclase (GGDEF)-like protein
MERDSSGKSGATTLFLPGEDKLADGQMRAISPEEMVWGHRSVAGLSDAVIMMVDDERLNIEMTQAFLLEAGYRHFVSTDKAETAIHMMAEEKPSLLLLDLSMPKVSGLEILEIMRADPVLCHLPAIVLTSTVDPQVKLQALSLGAMDFLSKPVDPSELALRIRNTLAATAYRDYLAQHDPLTGLPNKLRYKEAVWSVLEAARKRGQPGALVHVGVDQLAPINDALGRAVGDQLIQRIGKRLASCVETEGDGDLSSEQRPTLYRFDGDEFAVIIPRVQDVETAAAFISKLLEATAISFNRGAAQEIFVTCSIGVAVFPDDGRDLDLLMSNAGLAMRHAKESGAHTYEFFSPQLNEKAVRKLSRGVDLRRAFLREQVELLYQPRLDIRTGRLMGAETVVRWTRPEGEVLEGDTLLELAATSEMSMALTEWVLEQVTQQMKSWRLAGLESVRMGVNVSLEHLTLAQLADMVRKAIRGGLPPQYLCIELHAASTQPPGQDDVDAFSRLKRMGVRLALDDFGAAQSSLVQLRSLPIDEVKVHPLFFRQIEKNKEDAAFVTALLAMTRSLGRRFVATGIDTAAQLIFLKAHGCDECQGSLFNEPMRERDFARNWLARQKSAS